MVAGLRYVKTIPAALVLIYTLFCSMVVLPLGAMMAVFSDSILKVGATGTGTAAGFFRRRCAGDGIDHRFVKY